MRTGAGGPGRARGASAAVATPVVLSLGLLVVAGCLLGWYVPGALAEEAAYRSAPFCPGAPAPTGSRECLDAVPGTVVAKEPGGGRGSRLPGLRWTTDGRSAPSWVRLEEEGALFSSVSPGDRVRVVRWRGAERAVVAGPLRQETAATPVDGHRLPYAVGLGLVPLGGVFGWVAYGWARRPEGAARASWPVSVPMACGLVLGAVGFFGPLVTDGLLDALLLSAGTAVPVLAAGAWLLRRRRNRPPGTVEMLPRLPGRERRFPGAVVGAVPCEVAGFSTLVAGPEGLAVAAGEEPGAARCRVPGSVAAVRVRPRAHTDARAVRAGAGDWVVECRDGDREVLVVAAREDLPWVLGVLR
ncbi:hypothetical protein G3I34_26815 [Streptomyces sp. SID8014]|uniref:hypothetical protein n=1 Tax=Streptomyces sp. SID8014 TaxID=2706097 RepID=UPI0013BA5E32|nr:hypothetical protein [Streptomyces sp. SID8014]NEC15821.1 hypothetical protein [Streptomyces sp. SID8014]